MTTTSLLRKYTFLGDLPLTALPALHLVHPQRALLSRDHHTRQRRRPRSRGQHMGRLYQNPPCICLALEPVYLGSSLVHGAEPVRLVQRPEAGGTSCRRGHSPDMTRHHFAPAIANGPPASSRIDTKLPELPRDNARAKPQASLAFACRSPRALLQRSYNAENPSWHPLGRIG
ncbi:hypothetical protein N658DRAFT_361480 [Parathielavia hyrcaniae]|uniref:Uncharacterized protein n=1 Tax=Parathielavia hyrcaniae TaxID=113614 RepID=A0AAN6PR68_9PEZI|nr:hypothetical protein N658DRAFT_361480 [Parathielavia hyrcaniae]